MYHDVVAQVLDTPNDLIFDKNHLRAGTQQEQEEVLLEELLEEEDVSTSSHLIVYNDDHNTFEWVIECFMDILQHSSEQSEQLALIIHYKGKATVKTAPMAELKPKKDALVDRGLSAVIE
ncbi:MAG: ATP-dependent Clp protease adaptor ClpS [Saprospiraceae bacterium]|nr:ATP-dependent Clp protease adaptor ClpS [Saprospiraceae bacterium]